MEPFVSKEQFCRVCMKTSLPMLDFHMQLRDQNHLITILECFEFVTHIKLELNNNNSQKLCTECADELNNAFHFIRKAEESERRILDSIENLLTENTKEITNDQVLYETIVEEIIYDSESLNESNSAKEHGDEFGTQSSYSFHNIYTYSPNSGKELTDSWDGKECQSSYETIEDCQSDEEKQKVHANKNTNDFYCKICKKNFKNHRSLYQHRNRFHQSNKSTELSEVGVDSINSEHHCQVCFKTYKSYGLLKTHLRYHERKQLSPKSEACPQCGKCFVTSNYLRQHIDLVHATERPQLACEQCDKIYMTKNALENHKRIHTGQIVQCEECGKNLTNPYELKIHMRFHARDYPFQCAICNKKFAIKGHLRTHMWGHEGLKLSCEDCGKLFTSTKALTEHSFSHAEEMPFPCKYCNKSYPSKQKYKVHLKRVHNLDYMDTENSKTNNSFKLVLRKKKLPLVLADSVMKEVEIACKENENSEEFIVEIS